MSTSLVSAAARSYREISTRENLEQSSVTTVGTFIALDPEGRPGARVSTAAPDCERRHDPDEGRGVT
jgi:hypothetical protein